MFIQHFKSLFFSVGTVLGLALGIILGVLLPQPYGIGWLAIFGWASIPFDLINLAFGYNMITNQHGPEGFTWPEWAIWVRWGVVLYYALLLVCYGWYAYRATRQSGSMGDGLLSAVWVALVTIISALIPAVVATLGVNQDLPIRASFLSDLFYSLEGGAVLCAFVAIPLLVMALLAGLVGSWLGKLRSPHIDPQGG